MSAPPVNASESDSGGIPADDPLKTAEREAEFVAAWVREFLARLEASDAARFGAMSALLEAAERVVAVLKEATSPDRPGRAHVFAALELVVTVLDRLAPSTARALLDPCPQVRRAAAAATRAFAEPPSLARTARASAAHHPDAEVRRLLGHRPGEPAQTSG